MPHSTLFDKDQDPPCTTAPLPHSCPPTAQDLAPILTEIEATVPPLWPLKDYVAVNPFVGLSDQKFLAARQMLRAVRDCELLPAVDYFRDQLQQGQITLNDIERACRQCADEYPELYAGWDAEQVVQLMQSDASAPASEERLYHSISEVVDRQRQSNWTSHIINDITRHCGAHYDEGQASWANPWSDLTLYQAWREAALLSRRMDFLGIQGFRHLVGQLPTTPHEAIAWLLGELGLAKSHYRSFLQCELFSVAGWASFVKYRGAWSESADGRDEDLTGLLAIRLAYDVALARANPHDWPAFLEQIAPAPELPEAEEHPTPAPPADVLARYAALVAAERAYRRRLTGALTSRKAVPQTTGRKLAQMVFCIDVRSEMMRRHLEATSDALETFGFAGFFGMALKYVPFGESNGTAQCPVLLKPGFRVQETLAGHDTAAQESALHKRWGLRMGRKVWKSFQSSAVSCFTFVESFGLLYWAKLLTDSLGVTRPVAAADGDGLSRMDATVVVPVVDAQHEHGLSLTKKIDLSEAMLRNLGLTVHFARFVVLCGHASDVVNNPYKAALDCGACGGHSGEPNARVAAGLLNDLQVRAGLVDRGIHIPDDTWFLPAVHNTTTDEILWHDTAHLPDTHGSDFAQLQSLAADAGRTCRSERNQRHDVTTTNDAFRRSRDWSEVRPEWGLAGNIAFIVAPRSRTIELDLGGHAFMHSYDANHDPDLKVLELILTAPMIVTSWINLQYYASTVDNQSFGSGNKVIHNVVGQFGVLSGNGGDLMTGLPWQSVHDGVRLQHQPLRLLVVVESTRQATEQIICSHPMVRDLVSNGWMTFVVLEQEQCFRWTSQGTWEEEVVSRQHRSQLDYACV